MWCKCINSWHFSYLGNDNIHLIASNGEFIVYVALNWYIYILSSGSQKSQQFDNNKRSKHENLKNYEIINCLYYHCPDHELSVYMEDFKGHHSYANYTHFLVGDAATKYMLTVNGYTGVAG
jgi:hypothetical protein